VRGLWRWVARLASPTRSARVAARAGFGAGGDRTSLTLRPSDEALVRAVAAACPRTVVVVMAGSAVIMESWRDLVPAIVMLWYPGMEGGHALADLLLGRLSPSGRMPFTTPRDAAHLPPFDRDATQVTYDLWHGYRKLDRDGHRAAFPFGFGLSYTTFRYGPPRLRSDEVVPGDAVEVEVDMTNTGARDADEVVFVFATPVGSAVERAPKELRAFTRVHLPAGESRTATLRFPVRALAYFDEARDDFVVEAIPYDLWVMRHADDPEAQRVRLRVTSTRGP